MMIPMGTRGCVRDDKIAFEKILPLGRDVSSEEGNAGTNLHHDTVS